MKKKGFSVFLLSLVLPIIASSNKDSISEYTYISRSSYPSRDKVRFNADKTLDFFENGKWKHVDSVVPDKENLNFIVHKSDNPEFLQLFYGDDCETGLGVLSEDRRTLYMADVEDDFIFSREETKTNLKFATNYTYVNESDPSGVKVQFNADNSLDLFVGGGRINTPSVTWLDKKNRIFISHPDPKEDFDLVGVFSEDEKTLYLGEVGFFFELCSPKLTFDSINVGGITLRSTREDLIIQYPAARVVHEDNQVKFLVDGLDGFAYVNFAFKNDKLVHILKYESDLERDGKVSALVQKSVRELTAKYGKPKVKQSSPVYYPSYSVGRYTWDEVNKNESIFTWYGEVIITLSYDWVADKYGGHRYYGTCSIDYEFDSRDSGL